MSASVGGNTPLEDLERIYEKGGLILKEGAFCEWLLRRDGQATIHQIFVGHEFRNQGIARDMINTIKENPDVMIILAKCPTHYPSNSFWEKMGFENVREEVSRNGKTILNVWELDLNRGGRGHESHGPLPGKRRRPLKW